MRENNTIITEETYTASGNINGFRKLKGTYTISGNVSGLQELKELRNMEYNNLKAEIFLEIAAILNRGTGSLCDYSHRELAKRLIKRADYLKGRKGKERQESASAD